MFKYVLVTASLLAPIASYSQEQTPQTELEALKSRVKELEELQNETSEILKRQLSDQHVDQNSRGYIELKAGASIFEPKDIEDLNDDSFNDQNDATWKSFGHGNIVDLEIGKTLYANEFMKQDIGIGYQFFNSEATASFTPNGGGSRIRVVENVMIHTMYARYAALFKVGPSANFYFGPGITFGYSPVGKIDINLEQDNEGEKVTAEGTSYLLELFAKGKLEFSRYFSLVFTAGYRQQEIQDLRASQADIVVLNTKLDLDASGLFATGGLAVSF